MKKLISVITLIVMTSVNVMYPFTYADSLGDSFEEIQNFDETMQDDGDFSDEENTEDEENEDDESDLQEEQNDEEDENTAEEENENSDEEYEDDEEENTDETADNAENNEEENTDETADNTENKDEEDIENDENNEEQSEENNENDENTNEEDEDDDNSAIDLLKDLVEGSGNILSGEVLDFTGANLELTGEVIELTGEALELSIARETLNTDSIIGTENTKGVTVNVEAQAGIFPEGTELRIKPITLKKELNEIKEQIIDSQENVSEDSELVAFDISFIYTLSGGNEVEVQPKDGEGVKVTFDYQNNETLSKADNNDEQEVKVFHIDDKDVNGEKVEKGEEVIKDVTNKEESEEDGIAVVNAESFSVYAVVVTSGNGLRVIYDLNGGYWVEDHTTNPKTVIYTGTETNMFYRTPSKDGYMFMGWFNESLTTRRNGSVTDGMTVYAKWMPFYDLHAYILIDDEHVVHKNIMDRNVGATSNDYTNTASYGYYFQWGNNYGIGNSSDVGWTKDYTVPSSIWSLGISSKYYSRKLRSNDEKKNRMDSTNNSAGLWGGTGDTATEEGFDSTFEGRQGPCPDGYHVPSTVSWQQLFNDWNQIYNYTYANKQKTNVDKIIRDLGKIFLLPPAGRYQGSKLGANGTDISYWASSEWADDRDTAHGFYVGQYGTQPAGIDYQNNKGDYKNRARSIRCFKNNETSYLGKIEINGGTGGIITIVNGEVKALKNPTRGNDAFRGWYTTSNYSGNPIEIGSGLQQGDRLYAKWCAEGLIDDGSQCVNGYTITFDTDGGTNVPSQNVDLGGTGTRPTNPTKDGYSFLGWYLTGSQTEFNFNDVLTSNITIYAKWTPIEYTISYELNGGEVAISNPITYTIETQDFTLHNPTRVGYDFLGWSGTNLPECSVEEHSTCSETVSIQQGSTGNRKYTAIWQARDDIIVTINYNFQDLNPYTNKLEKTYTLSGTETSLETADATITLSDYALNFDGYIYDYGEVNGEKTETTTVLPNGNRVIDLYYTRNKYDFDLVTDPNSTTAGTSSTGQYYYGAKITLSGDVNSDCFMWSGWNVDGVVLENNTNQTSFYMPASNVTVESSVTEKTYNIIFDGNDETSGEMEAINGIRCTESRQLPLNTFKKTGYTFSGWTTEPNGEKEYNDRATIQTLTTGNDITLKFIAVWDINKYEVVWKNYNGDVLDTQELPYLDIPEYKGGTAPSRPADAQYTYTFAGWTPEYTGVTGPQVYTATYTQTINKYTITWKDGDGNTLKTEQIHYGQTPEYSGVTPTKAATAQYTYTFNNTWNPTITGVTENATYKAQFDSTVNKYTVTWKNDDGTELEKDENVPYGTMPSYDGSTPIKSGEGSGNYEFIGWNPTPSAIVGNTEYTAKYKDKRVPEDNGGQRRSGGGGRKHTTSQSEETDQHGSAEDPDKQLESEKEVFDAYKRAYKYGITTMDTEKRADPDGYVTRGHLAKMVVNFTVNVLGKEMPVDTPTQCKRKDDDSEWKSKEIKFYAEKSCALGLMGLYTKEFKPNKIVDRAEFGTVVSRLLWGNTYDELDTNHNLYFTKHLKALQESGFMKDIDNPLGRKEYRKRVWIVLKRIELEKDKMKKESD